MERRDITIRVGKAFYDFDVKGIEIDGKFKSYKHGNKNLDRVFVFINEHGNNETFESFTRPDNAVGILFGSKLLNDDNSFEFKYTFKKPGMYTFTLCGYDTEENKYEIEDFIIRIKFD